MRRSLGLLLIILVCAAGAHAEGGDGTEREPELPECVWSKMSKEDYASCLENRKKVKEMTPAERARYERRKERQTVVVDGVAGQTVRNVARNRPHRR